MYIVSTFTFFQSVLSQKINTKILRKKWDGSSNEHNCFQWQKLWKCIKLQDQVPLGSTGSSAIDFTQLGHRMCFGTKTESELEISVFLFSAKLLPFGVPIK